MFIHIIGICYIYIYICPPYIDHVHPYSSIFNFHVHLCSYSYMITYSYLYSFLMLIIFIHTYIPYHIPNVNIHPYSYSYSIYHISHIHPYSYSYHIPNIHMFNVHHITYSSIFQRIHIIFQMLNDGWGFAHQIHRDPSILCRQRGNLERARDVGPGATSVSGDGGIWTMTFRLKTNTFLWHVNIWKPNVGLVREKQKTCLWIYLSVY